MNALPKKRSPLFHIPHQVAPYKKHLFPQIKNLILCNLPTGAPNIFNAPGFAPSSRCVFPIISG